MANITFHDPALPAAALSGANQEVAAWDTILGQPIRIPSPALKRYRCSPVAITAAGSNSQAAATALSATYDYFEVTTVPALSGVKGTARGSSIEIGDILLVLCHETALNDLLFYPPTGGKINNLSINAPILVERGQVGMFLWTSTINLRTIP